MLTTSRVWHKLWFANVNAIKHYAAAVQAALRMNVGRETIVAPVTKLGRMYELQNDPRCALVPWGSVRLVTAGLEHPGLAGAGAVWLQSECNR